MRVPDNVFVPVSYPDDLYEATELIEQLYNASLPGKDVLVVSGTLYPSQDTWETKIISGTIIGRGAVSVSGYLCLTLSEHGDVYVPEYEMYRVYHH